eukprot:scaffold7751_cov229-Ochromonas_danica.AAC.5
MILSVNDVDVEPGPDDNLPIGEYLLQTTLVPLYSSFVGLPHIVAYGIIQMVVFVTLCGLIAAFLFLALKSMIAAVVIAGTAIVVLGAREVYVFVVRREYDRFYGLSLKHARTRVISSHQQLDSILDTRLHLKRKPKESLIPIKRVTKEYVTFQSKIMPSDPPVSLLNAIVTGPPIGSTADIALDREIRSRFETIARGSIEYKLDPDRVPMQVRDFLSEKINVENIDPSLSDYPQLLSIIDQSSVGGREDYDPIEEKINKEHTVHVDISEEEYVSDTPNHARSRKHGRSGMRRTKARAISSTPMSKAILLQLKAGLGKSFRHISTPAHLAELSQSSLEGAHAVAEATRAVTDPTVPVPIYSLDRHRKRIIRQFSMRQAIEAYNADETIPDVDTTKSVVCEGPGSASAAEKAAPLYVPERSTGFHVQVVPPADGRPKSLPKFTISLSFDDEFAPTDSSQPVMTPMRLRDLHPFHRPGRDTRTHFHHHYYHYSVNKSSAVQSQTALVPSESRALRNGSSPSPTNDRFRRPRSSRQSSAPYRRAENTYFGTLEVERMTSPTRDEPREARKPLRREMSSRRAARDEALEMLRGNRGQDNNRTSRGPTNAGWRLPVTLPDMTNSVSYDIAHYIQQPLNANVAPASIGMGLLPTTLQHSIRSPNLSPLRGGRGEPLNMPNNSNRK